MSKDNPYDVHEHVEPSKPWPRPGPITDESLLKEIFVSFKEYVASNGGSSWFKKCNEWLDKTEAHFVQKMSPTELAFNDSKGRTVKDISMDWGNGERRIDIDFTDGTRLRFYDGGPEHCVVLEARLEGDNAPT